MTIIQLIAFASGMGIGWYAMSSIRRWRRRRRRERDRELDARLQAAFEAGLQQGAREAAVMMRCAERARFWARLENVN